MNLLDPAVIDELCAIRLDAERRAERALDAARQREREAVALADDPNASDHAIADATRLLAAAFSWMKAGATLREAATNLRNYQNQKLPSVLKNYVAFADAWRGFQLAEEGYDLAVRIHEHAQAVADYAAD